MQFMLSIFGLICKATFIKNNKQNEFKNQLKCYIDKYKRNNMQIKKPRLAWSNNF